MSFSLHENSLIGFIQKFSKWGTDVKVLKYLSSGSESNLLILHIFKLLIIYKINCKWNHLKWHFMLLISCDLKWRFFFWFFFFNHNYILSPFPLLLSSLPKKNSSKLFQIINLSFKIIIFITIIIILFCIYVCVNLHIYISKYINTLCLVPKMLLVCAHFQGWTFCIGSSTDVLFPGKTGFPSSPPPTHFFF